MDVAAVLEDDAAGPAVAQRTSYSVKSVSFLTFFPEVSQEKILKVRSRSELK